MKVAATLAILCLVATFDRCTSATLSLSQCASCIGGDCEEPEDCQHGIAIDFCGRKVCAKGPGQRCGGRWSRHGVCGDGMFCGCNSRCGGCSLATLECYNPKCV